MYQQSSPAMTEEKIKYHQPEIQRSNSAEMCTVQKKSPKPEKVSPFSHLDTAYMVQLLCLYLEQRTQLGEFWHSYYHYI